MGHLDVDLSSFWSLFTWAAVSSKRKKFEIGKKIAN